MINSFFRIPLTAFLGILLILIQIPYSFGNIRKNISTQCTCQKAEVKTVQNFDLSCHTNKSGVSKLIAFIHQKAPSFPDIPKARIIQDENIFCLAVANTFKAYSTCVFSMAP